MIRVAKTIEPCTSTVAANVNTLPKKPANAFQCFCKEERAQILSENPGADFGELARLLGALWAKLRPHERQVYDDMSFAENLRSTQLINIITTINSSPSNQFCASP